ncbi:MAG: histidinol-phosphatase HisJ family protein [Candidatus Caenarcaniphilales bacterium]|nr:histidinol-phosphatase HisJ family protein [Candidatus Caenarcaniphilales bacterium]
MKLFSDYHNHPLGHDPNRRYDEATLKEWLTNALERGLSDIAFTDHDRYHAGVDFESFRRFQEGLPDGTIFRLGIELDNDPETSLEGHRWTEKNYDRLDFVLGSVHFIGDWPFDHPSHKEEFSRRDINKLYEEYFKEIQRTARSDLVDGLAHLDLIKIFGDRPTVDLTWLYEETLQVIKESGKTLEISTAGWRKPVNELYPQESLLPLIKELAIPITVASDAHAPTHLASDYGRLAIILQNHGFTEVTVFDKHKQIKQSLN